MINRYNCVIVDDEENAIELIATSIKALYKNIDIAGTYTTWEDALEGLGEKQADIVYMDISMPGKNGIHLLKLLPNLQSEIIFITAHEEYAIDAFDFSTSGYILKPVEDLKLKAATDKAIERVQHKKLALYNNAPMAANAKIGIPNNKGVDYINIADIIYLESVNRCTRIVTTSGHFTSSYYISRFKSFLQGHLFYQVHRSYIINLGFISRYESLGIVIMSDKKNIPVSRFEKDNFLKFFNIVTRGDKMEDV